MRLNKSGLRTSRLIFAASASVLIASNSLGAANTFSWTGTAGDGNWLTSGNWNDTTSATPGPPAATNSDVGIFADGGNYITTANTSIGSSSSAASPTVILGSSDTLDYSDFFGGSSNLTNGVAATGNPDLSSNNSNTWYTFSATSTQPGSGFQISGIVNDDSLNSDNALMIGGQTTTNTNIVVGSVTSAVAGVLINSTGTLENTGVGILRLGATNIADDGTIYAAPGSTLSLGNGGNADLMFSDPGSNGQLNIAAGATATDTDQTQNFTLGGNLNNSLVTNNNGTFLVATSDEIGRGTTKTLTIDGGTFNNAGTFTASDSVTNTPLANATAAARVVNVYIGTGVTGSVGYDGYAKDAAGNTTTFNNTGTINVINSENDAISSQAQGDAVLMDFGKNVNFSNAGNFNVVSTTNQPLNYGNDPAPPSGNGSNPDVYGDALVYSSNNWKNAGGNVVVNGAGAIMDMLYTTDTVSALTTTYLQTSGTTLIENQGLLVTAGMATAASSTVLPTNHPLGGINISGGTVTVNSGGAIASNMISLSGASTVMTIGNGGYLGIGWGGTFHPFEELYTTSLSITGGATLNLQQGSIIPTAVTDCIGNMIGGLAVSNDGTINVGNASETFQGLASATNSGVVNLNNTTLTIAGRVNGYAVGSSAVQNGAVLTETYSGAIAGTGSLVVSGGSLVLGGANTFSGTTTINSAVNAGTVVELNSSGSLPNTGLVLGGGTLQLDSGQTGENFTSGGTTLAPGASAIVDNTASTLALGAISRSAGATIDFGSGTTITTSTPNANPTGGQQTILGGYATYGNGSTWAVSGSGATPGAISGLSTYNTLFTSGTDVDAPSGTSTPGTVTINSLRFNSGGSTVGSGSGDTLTIATGGILDTTGGGSSTIQSSGLTTNSGQEIVVNQYNTSNPLTISSVISGANVGLTKSGGGDLIVSGANTYGGATNIAAGTLEVSGVGQLSNNINLSNGAILNVDGNATLSSSTNINGTGSLQVWGQNLSSSVVSTLSGAPQVNFLGSGTTQVINQLNGTAIVALSNLNNYNNLLQGGITLKVTGGGTFGGIFTDAPTQLFGTDTLEVGGTAPLILTSISGEAPGANSANGFSGSVVIDAGATLQVGNGTTPTAVMPVNEPASSSYGGVTVNGNLVFDTSQAVQYPADGYDILGNAFPANIQTITGSGNIIQKGAGTTLIEGNLTNFTGGIYVNAGSLVFANNTAVTVPLSSSIGIVDNSHVVFQESPAPASGVPVNLVISGTGDLTVTGNVTNSGGGPVIFEQNNTYSGPTYLGDEYYAATSGTSAVLRVGNGGTTGSLGTGPVYIDASANVLVFDLSSTVTIPNAISGEGGMGFIGGGTYILTSNNNTYGGESAAAAAIGGNSTLQIGNGGTSGTFSNNGSQGIALNIAGGSVTSISNASTYQGVSGVAGFGTIAFDRSDTIYIPNAMTNTVTYTAGVVTYPTGQLSVTQMGSGTTVLTGNNTYAGQTNINSGTLQVGDYGTSGSLGATANAVGGNINDNGALVFARTDSGLTITGAIGGSGSVTQLATGTTTLDLQNTYSGPTTIDAGTLVESFSALAPASSSGNQTLTNFINPSSTLALAGGTLSVSGRANSTATSLATSATGGTAFGSTVSVVTVTSTSGLEPGQVLSDTSGDFLAGTYVVSILNSTQFTISSPTQHASTGSEAISATAVTNTNNQTVNNVTVNAGQSAVVATSAGVGTAVTLGTITRNAGGLVDFTLPAGSQSSTNQITTTTANANPAGGQQTILGGWATVGGYGSWAVSGSGATAGQISALGTYASAFTAGTDVSAAAGNYTPGTITLNSLRFNSAGAYNLNDSGAGDTLTIASGGILETSTVGANQVVFNQANLTSGNGQDLILLQNDTNAAGFMTVNSNIVGGIGLTKGAAGTVYLNGNNTYTGPTTVGAGTLVVGDFGSTGSLGVSAAGILDDGTLAFNRTDNGLTVSNNISGYGGVAQVGTGTTTLTGTESYLGATTLTAGTLVLGSTASVNPLSALTLGGGTLSIAARNSSLTFGNIAFNTMASGFGGTTTIAAGLSNVNASAGLGSGNTLALNNIERSTGGVVNFALPTDGSSITTTSYNVNSVLGGWATVGGNTWAVSAASTTSAGAISGLSSYSSSFAANANVDAPTGVSTPGSLTINTLRFNNVGGYTIGSGSGDTLDVTTGGILETSNVGANAVTIDSSVLSSGNQQDLVVIQNNTAAAMTINSVINNSGSTSTVGGGGVALTKAGQGTVILNGTNTYTGGTYIDDAGSTVDFSADANLGAASGALTFSGGTLEDTNTGSFSTARNMTLNPGGGTLGVAGGGTLIASGVISGASTLTKVDTGTLVLTGANTYIGPTTISAGTLEIGNNGATGSLGIFAGAIIDNGNLAYNLTGNVTLANAVKGSGSVTQLNTGSLVLTGVNSYTGGTDINSGSVVASTAGSLPNGGPVTNNGALLVNANNTTGAINGTGTITVAPSTTLSLATGSGGSSTTALTLGTLSTLNINNNHVFINYGSPANDPIDSIAALIASGYNGGTWTGAGIMSTTAQSNPSYGIGYADSADLGNPAGLSSGQIEIAYTLLGDANLDYKVNGADFTLMAANFNDSVTAGWDKGDFNYSNTVNGDDFVLLADNFNDFAAQSAVTAADLTALDDFAAANGISLTSVPEPASLGLLTLGTVSILSRRRRRR